MLQNDSRKVKKGDTFIAIKGIKNDGHDYIDEAIKNGAAKVIVEYGNYENMIKVENTSDYLHSYVKEHYLPIIKKLKIIGITGTNGKTTTAYLIYQALNKLNINCAYIGTIGFYINKIHKKNINTTPDILTLYNMLLTCVFENIEYVVMEVSSQGLSYNRVDGIEFDYAIFTNLTMDHLDFHKTMKNYLNAKLKLFQKLKTNGIGIINSDSNYCDYFKMGKFLTYGTSGDYKISDIDYNINKSSFKINDYLYHMQLIGDYNVYNMCTVIIILKLLKIEDLKIRNIVETLENAPGRMEKIRYKDNVIIIDYAHTPDATLKILKTLQNKGTIITVIGCGGNRQKDKRKIMGFIAVHNSNYVIFTSDNPRNENAKNIIKDMLKDVDTSNYEIEINRKKAIIKGIQKLTKNDILLILGKGHEDYQEIKGVRYHFNDKEIVLKNI